VPLTRFLARTVGRPVVLRGVNQGIIPSLVTGSIWDSSKWGTVNVRIMVTLPTLTDRPERRTVILWLRDGTGRPGRASHDLAE
jgi:hypothetical protein